MSFLSQCVFREISLFGAVMANCAITLRWSLPMCIMSFASISAAVNVFSVHQNVVQLFLSTFWCPVGSLLSRHFSVYHVGCCEFFYHQPLLHPVSSLVSLVECGVGAAVWRWASTSFQAEPAYRLFGHRSAFETERNILREKRKVASGGVEKSLEEHGKVWAARLYLVCARPWAHRNKKCWREE